MRLQFYRSTTIRRPTLRYDSRPTCVRAAALLPRYIIGQRDCG